MVKKHIEPEEYLNKDFDYKKLTKSQLAQIMYENNVQDIPGALSLKQEFLNAYKSNIHDRIEEIKEKRNNVVADGKDIEYVVRDDNFSEENPFQSSENDEIVKKPKVRIGAVHIPRTPTKEENVFSPKKTPSIKKPVESSPVGVSRNRSIIHTPKRVEKKIQHPTYFKHTLKKKSKFRFLYFFVFLIPFYVYFKFFCPYCLKGPFNYNDLLKDPLKIQELCINLPEHAYVEDNRILCKEGYILKKNYVFRDACEVDSRKMKRINKKTNEIINFLRHINGDYLYGVKEDNRVPLREIEEMVEEEDRDEVIKKVLEHKEIKMFNYHVWSKEYKIGIHAFLKFYLKKTLKVVGVPALFLSFVYFIIKILKNRKRKRMMDAEKAESLVKDVIEALSTQAFYKEGSSSIPLMQLKDYFSVEESVWKEVETRVRKNSNVRENMAVVNGEQKRVWEWIGPVVFTPHIKKKMADVDITGL